MQSKTTSIIFGTPGNVSSAVHVQKRQQDTRHGTLSSFQIYSMYINHSNALAVILTNEVSRFIHCNTLLFQSLCVGHPSLLCIMTTFCTSFHLSCLARCSISRSITSKISKRGERRNDPGRESVVKLVLYRTLDIRHIRKIYLALATRDEFVSNQL